VLAVEKAREDPGQKREDRAHYVMVVRPVRGGFRRSGVYERMGIGMLPGRSLVDKGSLALIC
jgi:hypothetical protein